MSVPFPPDFMPPLDERNDDPFADPSQDAGRNADFAHGGPRRACTEKPEKSSKNGGLT
jgi:hypothetical protein